MQEDAQALEEYANTIRRRILLFPRGNNVDHVSMYLEQGHEDDEKAPPGWYACVQFTLVMWNKNDPSIQKSQCKALAGLLSKYKS